MTIRDTKIDALSVVAFGTFAAYLSFVLLGA